MPGSARCLACKATRLSAGRFLFSTTLIRIRKWPASIYNILATRNNTYGGAFGGKLTTEEFCNGVSPESTINPAWYTCYSAGSSTVDSVWDHGNTAYYPFAGTVWTPDCAVPPMSNSKIVPAIDPVLLQISAGPQQDIFQPNTNTQSATASLPLPPAFRLPTLLLL